MADAHCGTAPYCSKWLSWRSNYSCSKKPVLYSDHKKPLHDGIKKRKQGEHRKGSDWSATCLNVEHCKGIHIVRECPITSESKKKELLDIYLQEKPKNNNALFKAKMMATNREPEVLTTKRIDMKCF